MKMKLEERKITAVFFKEIYSEITLYDDWMKGVIDEIITLAVLRAPLTIFNTVFCKELLNN
jgi:hypothetical protein